VQYYFFVSTEGILVLRTPPVSADEADATSYSRAAKEWPERKCTHSCGERDPWQPPFAGDGAFLL